MALPYHLGCPSWSDAAWRGRFYPADAQAAENLELYAQVFNAVEGNTTFYAWPAPGTVERWARIMPQEFRFTAKFPREVSHGADLPGQLETAWNFIRSLRPLGERVAPLWLQLPASFGPERLGELATFIEGLGCALAVEVRHLAFFDKGPAERALNRLLRDTGVERICLDSRALFSVASNDPGILHAQGQKPKVPVRPAAFSQSPQVRFIGLPRVKDNAPFLVPWVDKVAEWIEEGRRPYIFLHTADNRDAPALARYFHEQLSVRLPALPALPTLPSAEASTQLGLL